MMEYQKGVINLLPTLLGICIIDNKCFNCMEKNIFSQKIVQTTLHDQIHAERNIKPHSIK